MCEYVCSAMYYTSSITSPEVLTGSFHGVRPIVEMGRYLACRTSEPWSQYHCLVCQVAADKQGYPPRADLMRLSCRGVKASAHHVLIFFPVPVPSSSTPIFRLIPRTEPSPIVSPSKGGQTTILPSTHCQLLLIPNKSGSI